MKNISFKFFNRIKGNKMLYLLSLTSILIVSSCKKQLDQINPNAPTLAGNVTNESSIAAFSMGTVYWDGFNYGDGWLGDSYFSLPWGYHELMGDVVGGGQGSNNQTTTMGVPDKFVADLANPSTTTFINSSPQVSIIRSFNTTAATANNNNALFYEWLNMYALIKGCNQTLQTSGSVGLSVDKANAIKAWSYWWKGYAYAQIGTLYYAGLIVDNSSNVFVNQAAVITESNKQLNLALTTLKAISNQGDYASMITQLIPIQNQVGLGKPLSNTQFQRTINTMLARNILLNHLSPFVNGNPAATISKSAIMPMAAADWASIISYCNAGIQNGDYVFTGRTSGTNSFFSNTGGSVAGICSFSNQSTTYKISERLIQSFKTSDKRLQNFSTGSGIFYGDANTNSTRWSLIDGDATGLSGIPILGSRNVGKLEIYIGTTYEENALMLAEANIRTGQIAAGLAYVDAVRSAQGAGIAPVAGTVTTLSGALSELTMERSAALAFRGLSFYDARRWGWTYNTANGGGRYGTTVIYNKMLYNNATINYNYMDFWDVPADEVVKNPPAAGSAAVVNANY